MSLEMDELTTIECLDCHRKISLEQFLSECGKYLQAVRVIQHKCPQCGCLSEVQIELGEICFGYVYAAGDLHFCGVEQFDVAGLSRLEQPNGLKLFLGDREWIIPN